MQAICYVNEYYKGKWSLISSPLEGGWGRDCDLQSEGLYATLSLKTVCRSSLLLIVSFRYNIILFSLETKLYVQNILE